MQISRETAGSEAYVKRFDGYQHLVVMLFGILKHFDSLRELEIGMKAEAHKLRHLGMDYLVRRSTLAEANIRRSQEFFAKVYAYLLDRYAKFLADSRPPKSYKGQTHEPKDWEKLLYMMDSTTITLFDNILKGVGRHQVREEEGRDEGAYGDEVSRWRADGGAAHIGREARPLPAQGGASAQGSQSCHRPCVHRHSTVSAPYGRGRVLCRKNEEKPQVRGPGVCRVCESRGISDPY